MINVFQLNISNETAFRVAHRLKLLFVLMKFSEKRTLLLQFRRKMVVFINAPYAADCEFDSEKAVIRILLGTSTRTKRGILH